MPRMLFTTVAVVLGVLVIGGCGGGGPQAGRTPSATATPTTTAWPTPTISRIETRSTALPGATLNSDGLGPVKLGLSVAEGRDRGWVVRMAHCDRWGASPALAAEGVDLIFDAQDRLTEVWLGNATHRTEDWARVGMTVEDVTALYRERLDYEPRDTVAGRLSVPVVRRGPHELVFFAIGDEQATPGPRAPVSAIAARAYGVDVQRPRC